MDGEVIPKKIKNNFSATTTPTVNYDKSEGWTAGSIVYIPTTGATYLCVSNAEGAAVWRLLSGEQYLGTWNPATNTPTLADGTGTAATYYISSVNGTVDLGSGFQNFTAGDKVIASSSIIWQKQEGGVDYVPVNKAGDTMTGNLSVPKLTATQRIVAGINTETLSGDKTITATSEQNQILDPNGANRNVTLYASPTAGDYFLFKNSGTGGFNLVLKNNGGTTLATIGNGVVVAVLYDGTNWILV